MPTGGHCGWAAPRPTCYPLSSAAQHSTRQRQSRGGVALHKLEDERVDEVRRLVLGAVAHPRQRHKLLRRQRRREFGQFSPAYPAVTVRRTATTMQHTQRGCTQHDTLTCTDGNFANSRPHSIRSQGSASPHTTQTGTWTACSARKGGRGGGDRRLVMRTCGSDGDEGRGPPAAVARPPALLPPPVAPHPSTRTCSCSSGSGPEE